VPTTAIRKSRFYTMGPPLEPLGR